MPVTQIVVNSVIRGSELALLAIGVTMIFNILKFANFAHGEFALLGAYFALFFSVTLGLNLYLAALISIVLTGLVGVYTNEFIFKRLRGMGGLTLMIAAMGLSIALRNGVRTVWGADPKRYQIGLGKCFSFWGGRVTSTQLLIMVISGLSMLAFHLLLHRTKFGKAMRATSDNIPLALASGINVEKVIVGVWFICTSLAAIGGILIGMDTLLWPEMGFGILLPVFCAAILGGIGNPYGAVLGAMVLGFVEHFGLFVNWTNVISLGGIFNIQREIYIPTGYKYAISFGVLIAVLIFRPSGILKGQKGD